MANMNTLFKKGYLFAVVIMAANIFTGNEVKAMDPLRSSLNSINTSQKNGEREGNHVRPGDKSEPNIMDKVLSKILSHENLINLIGGAVFSGFNNYFKWWDYNPGGYFKLGCPGWRFKRLLNGMFQFEVNFNLGRGAFWLISYIIFRRSLIKSLIKIEEIEEGSGVKSYIKVILQGFVSMPLTFHIPKLNLSISISLDSIIWIGIGKFLYKGEAPIKIKIRGEKENTEQNITDNENKSILLYEPSEEKNA